MTKEKKEISIKEAGAKVRKANVFIDGRYRFGLLEQKILLLIISKIKRDEKEFSPYFVSWSELQAIGKANLTSTKKIDASCEKLKNKTIKVKLAGGSEDNFGFLSGWKTVPGQGVEFRIDQAMKSLLLDLLEEGRFTLFDLECVMALGSPHSIRFYEVLKSHEWKGQPIRLTLDEIKYSLDVDINSPTYSNFSNFRSKILIPSQKAFKEHTDITFTFDPIKAGRKVVSLEITIKKNPRYQKTIQGEAIKQETAKLTSGDIILIAGKEYTFTDGGIMMSEGALPTGRIMQLLRDGRATIKQ